MLSGAKYEVKTQRAVIGNRGTQYEINITDDADIVSCYEGSVEVKMLKMKLDNGDALKQLVKDYQDGKITKEEFAEKSKELTSGINENTLKTSLIINTGQYCTAGGMLSDAMPITNSGGSWFDDSKFFNK